MTSETIKNMKINDHINHTKGKKTVCVSTCLNFFNVPMDSYSYTSSYKNRKAYEVVLRNNGYSVRSKKSEFKAMKRPTMTQLRTQMKKSKYTENDMFIVLCDQKTSAHLVVLNGKGETIIDTAPKMKWRIESVSIVEKL